MLSFFRALVTDKSGQFDEAAFSYLVAQGCIIAGFIYNTIVTKHFDAVEFMSGQAALVTLYNITVKK